MFTQLGRANFNRAFSPSLSLSLSLGITRFPRRYANGSKVLIIKWQSASERASARRSVYTKRRKGVEIGGNARARGRDVVCVVAGGWKMQESGGGQKYTRQSPACLRVYTTRARGGGERRGIEMRGKYRAGRNVNFVAV